MLQKLVQTSSLTWTGKNFIMIAKIYSSALHGVEAFRITVEVSLSGKGIGVLLTGLPDDAIKESIVRIESAIQSCGYIMPRTKIVINLIPADSITCKCLPVKFAWSQLFLVNDYFHSLFRR